MRHCTSDKKCIITRLAVDMDIHEYIHGYIYGYYAGASAN